VSNWIGGAVLWTVGTISACRAVSTVDVSHRLDPVALPVARSGIEDKGVTREPRIVITIAPEGAIYLASSRDVQSRQVNAELPRALEAAQGAYHRRMNESAQSGFERDFTSANRGRETQYSRLYVLIRADKSTAWGHVKRVIDAARNTGFYKLQMAVAPFAGDDWNEEDVQDLGLPYRRCARRDGTRLDHYLAIFQSAPLEQTTLPAAGPRVHVKGPHRVRVEIDHALPRRVFVSQLFNCLRELPRATKERVAVSISAGMDVSTATVVAVIDAVVLAGFQRIDL